MKISIKIYKAKDPINKIIKVLIVCQVFWLFSCFDNNFDKYPNEKKKINEDKDAPSPNKYLLVIWKFFEKFPKKKTVSE